MRRLLTALIFLLVISKVPAQSANEISKKAYLVNFHLKDGTTRSGIWHFASDSTVEFYENDTLITFAPEQVYKFEIRKLNSAKRNTLIGAGIGFTLGFIIGFTDDPDARDGYAQVGYASGVAILGAFSGAIIGHITGLIGKSYYVLGSLEQYKKIQPELQKYNRTTV